MTKFEVTFIGLLCIAQFSVAKPKRPFTIDTTGVVREDSIHAAKPGYRKFIGVNKSYFQVAEVFHSPDHLIQFRIKTISNDGSCSYSIAGTTNRMYNPKEKRPDLFTDVSEFKRKKGRLLGRSGDCIVEIRKSYYTLEFETINCVSSSKCPEKSVAALLAVDTSWGEK